MSALADAHFALEDGRRRAADAEEALRTARANVEALRARVGAGDASIDPADLMRARGAVEHAELVAEGAHAPLGALEAAVQAAEIDRLCDATVGDLRRLGSRIIAALDEVESALAPLVAACGDYDTFVRNRRSMLANAVPAGHQRFSQPRAAHASIDGMRLAECRGASHLLKRILPAARALGLPQHVEADLGLVVGAAPDLPNEDGR